MSEEIEKFFSLIYGDTDKYISINTKSETGLLQDERWFTPSEDLEFMGRYVDIRDDEDVYCSVNPFGGKERTKDDPEAISRVVYADLDACDPKHLRLPPSILVQTSPGRWHGWWVLDEEVSAKAASEASRRIYLAHKDKGCDAGWAVGKLLRVPGTSNTKNGEPYPVTATYSGEVYTLDTINDVYGDIDINPVAEISDEVPPEPDAQTMVELEQVITNNNLTNLYLRKPSEGESWSERAYRLELELFRTGLPAQDVYYLAREAACNKYNPENAGEMTQTGILIPRRSNPDLVLWREVQKAYAEYQLEAEVEEDMLPVTSPKAMNFEFLSVDERRYCEETPTFVDNYVKWAMSRSDSAEVYQHSAAYMILSCVFAGRGFIPLRWGDTELNLWILFLGDTTRTRKSTAANNILNVIHRFEQQTGIKIDAGSDATGEALQVELAKRNGLPALQHKDEVHGWFGSLYSKQYMAGVLEIMTAMYDGKVPIILRNSKESGNKDHVRTAFNFIGIGIRKRMSEVLTRGHFESGFLARMLWSVADPPPRKKGSENIAFREVGKYTGYNDDIQEMVDDLIARVAMWPTDSRAPITMDKAAQNRYNEWAEEGLQRAERYGDGEVVIPSFTRMLTSVIKAAALLAMYDQTDVITLKHLLPALRQAEFWFRDMVRMASEISSSEFERRLDEVEGFIASHKDKIRSEVEVRKKFTKFRPRDWQEIFEALKGSGRIRNVRDKRGYLEALT